MAFELEVLKSRLAINGLTIEYVPETGSTNADLRAIPDVPEGTVLIAGAQSAGRGRNSRAFASPEGGLYMSVMLHPQSVAEALGITPLAAVAVARAIEEQFGLNPGIKWVNDILIDGKKVCGILAEAVQGERLNVVLGIGVNVTQPEGGFSEGLRDIAGALFENPPEHAREKLAAAILNGLFARNFDTHSEYVRRSAVLGRTVMVNCAGDIYQARAVAIDERFRLVVERGEERIHLNSGEVSIKL